MTSLRRNVNSTRFRLAMNDYFSAQGWCLLVAAVVWIIVALADKLFDLGLPWLHLGLALAGLSLLTAVIWARMLRKDDLTAATILDRAAGLQERTSSGLFCSDSSDPFAQAVTQDAETANQSISVRSFIKFRWPASLSLAAVALVFALGISFLPISPLQAGQDSATSRDLEEEIRKTEVKRAKRNLQELKDRIEKQPGLSELKKQLKTIDDLPVEKLNTLTSIRREAIKKIEKFSDTMKRARDEKFDRMQELKRMFRGLKAQREPKTPTEKLAKALAKGDFKAARDAVREMKEKLAKMAVLNDPEKQKEMQEQLEKLAKQLEQVAKQKQRKEQLKKEMQSAGLDPETAKRLLENLTKQDIQKALEEMKKNGASQKQLEEMAKKCKACQNAGSQGSSLAEAMQQAAQAMKSDAGMADAAAALEQMGDQLNASEQLQQQLGELDAMLADAQDMKNEMSDGDNDGDCQNCGGKGCSKCGGSGKRQGRGGMGRLGRGRGGRADDQETAVRFKKERTPVHTTAGSIIGKMFIDGEQIRGDVSSEAVELMAAAQRDATDAINKNKIPNQYSDAVKSYFSRSRRAISGNADSAEADDADQPVKNSGKSGE